MKISVRGDSGSFPHSLHLWNYTQYYTCIFDLFFGTVVRHMAMFRPLVLISYRDSLSSWPSSPLVSFYHRATISSTLNNYLRLFMEPFGKPLQTLLPIVVLLVPPSPNFSFSIFPSVLLLFYGVSSSDHNSLYPRSILFSVPHPSGITISVPRTDPPCPFQ